MLKGGQLPGVAEEIVNRLTQIRVKKKMKQIFMALNLRNLNFKKKLSLIIQSLDDIVFQNESPTITDLTTLNQVSLISLNC